MHPNHKKTYLSQIYITLSIYLLIANLNAFVFSEEGLQGSVSGSPKKIRILSLDGGGVKGISEARFLQHLEANLGKTVSDTFHLIGGTSAGGILATFLTTPIHPGSTQPKYSAQDLVDILQERSVDMFVPNYLSFGGMFGPKYKSENLRTVIAEYLGNETTEITTIPTMVVTYDTIKQDFKLISSWNTEEEEKEIFSKVDALNATAAAATYFKPCCMRPINNLRKSYTLTDGGTGANNPTLCLLTKAIGLYPSAEEFEIVSIGSGKANRPLFYQEMKDAGLIQWAPHLTRVFMNGETAKDDRFLSKFFSNQYNQDGVNNSFLKGKYTRWSPILSKENTKMDNTHPLNLMTIVSATDHYIEVRQQDFNELVNRLRSPKYVF